jgi:hypothetical protein
MVLILGEETHLVVLCYISGAVDIAPWLAGSVIQGNVVGREKAQSRQSRCSDDQIINAIDVATYPAAEDGGAQSVCHAQAVGEVERVLEANPALVRFCHSRASTTTLTSGRETREQRSAYRGEDKDAFHHLCETGRHMNIPDIPFLQRHFTQPLEGWSVPHYCNPATKVQYSIDLYARFAMSRRGIWPDAGALR